SPQSTRIVRVSPVEINRRGPHGSSKPHRISAGTRTGASFGSSSTSVAATSMEIPANARPPYRVPVFCVMKPTKDGPKNPPRFPAELIKAIPLAAENPVKNSLGIAQKGLRELQ